MAEDIKNSPAARGQNEKQGHEAPGLGDIDDKTSGAARALARTGRSIAGFAEQISKDIDTAIVNKAADRERTVRNYEAFIALEKGTAGKDGESQNERRLALIELDDAAMEAILERVHKIVEDKTGKHFEFSTEEHLLRHILTILEAAVPTRKVLLGALIKSTVEDAVFTLESRYEYVKDEITNTAVAGKIPFEARLKRMKNQDQKILTVAEIAFCKVSPTYAARCAQKPKDAVAGQRVL